MQYNNHNHHRANQYDLWYNVLTNNTGTTCMVYGIIIYKVFTINTGTTCMVYDIICNVFTTSTGTTCMVYDFISQVFTTNMYGVWNHIQGVHNQHRTSCNLYTWYKWYPIGGLLQPEETTHIQPYNDKQVPTRKISRCFILHDSIARSVWVPNWV